MYVDVSRLHPDVKCKYYSLDEIDYHVLYNDKLTNDSEGLNRIMKTMTVYK